MKITLERVGHVAFEATSESGVQIAIDGSPEIGGKGRGMRPMELILAAVASCSAMEVVHILVNKQKEPLEGLRVEIEGQRADGVPSPFTRMKLVFIATGNVDEHKLERAVSLGLEKYCSARATIPGVEVAWEARREPST